MIRNRLIGYVPPNIDDCESAVIIERMVDQALETASLAPGNDEQPGEIT